MQKLLIRNTRGEKAESDIISPEDFKKIVNLNNVIQKNKPYILELFEVGD